MKLTKKRFFWGGLALVIGIQFIPVTRDNPPITETISAPAEVMTVLETACFDCHSHQTNWPFYSYIAPASWLVSQDVVRGREHLNFSTWDQYVREKREHLIYEIWEEVKSGHMPPGLYVLTHPEADMDATAQNIIQRWADR